MPKIFEAPPGFVLNPDYLVPELEAQRDALLETLRRIGQRCPRSIMKHPPHLIHQEMAHDAGAWARAAIKAVEGEQA